MTQSRLWAVFLLDTSSPVRLDGLDRPPPEPPAYSSSERSSIWDGLENLAAAGRLKLVKQVKEELKRHDPAALARLKTIPGHRMPPTNNALRRRYQSLVGTYPRLVPYDPRYDPADPWLIAAAQQYGYTVVTEELPRSTRRSRPKRGPPIPDLCDDLGIPWTSLRGLALAEEWIP